MGRSDTKKVYVTQPDGKSIDASTGAPVASVPTAPRLYGSQPPAPAPSGRGSVV